MSEGLRLLASIIENNSTQTFRQLEEELFIGREELAVYQFIRSHYRRYSEFPTIETVESECEEELPDTPEHVEYYLSTVRHRHIYLQYREEFPNVRNALANSDFDALTESTHKLSRICRVHAPQQDLVAIPDLSSSIFQDYLENRLSCGITGIPTGWEYLDTVSGGYQPSDFIVIAARPGVGKTSIAIHNALRCVYHGKSVLFVSMEMSLKQITLRAAAQVASLDPYHIRTGRLCMWGERRLQQGLDIVNGMRGFHLYAGNFKKTTDDIDLVIQELRPDLVIIDGIYILSPSVDKKNRFNRFEKVAEVVDDTKRICLMRDVPILATTQFSREAGKNGKDGSMETIGYTDAFSQHASIIMSISNGAKRIKSHRIINTDNDSGDVTSIVNVDQYPTRVVEIIKGREGESGKFTIHYSFAPINFSQVSEEELALYAEQDTVDTGYMI